jgi:ABC-type sulfate transport system substrate-binding protein
MITLEEAKKARKKYEKKLMKKEGVVGCGVGYKRTGGERTNFLAVICYVSKKKSKSELKKKDIIPEQLKGVPTDVIESGEFQAT